ncbi:MAG: adenylate/guanylate cyclase domain-containing protein [Pseudomonadota bacterium]
MGRLKRIDWLAVLLGLVMLLGVGLVFADRGLQVRAVEEAVFDQYQRWQPRPYLQPDPNNPEVLVPPPVLVVDIDEESLRELGQWPWPRYYMAELVWRLRDAGAAVIAFDVLFPEADRTSPAEQARAYQRFGELYAAAVQAFEGMNQATPIDHDVIFADAINRNPVVLAMSATNSPPDDRLPRQPKGIGISGEPTDISAVVDDYGGAIINLPVLSEGAQGIGAISLAADATTMVRTVPMVVAIGGNRWVFPSLAIEALRVAQNAQSHVIKTSVGSGQTDFSDTPVMVSMKTGGAEVPLSQTGHLRVRYSGASSERVISALDLLGPDGLSPEVAERVSGKIIFVGSSAAGLFDIRQTPMHHRIAGVHVHAEIAEQIIAQDFLSRPNDAVAVERLMTVIGGVIVVLLIAYNLPVLGFGALTILLAVILGGSWYAFSAHSLLLTPVGPAMGVALPYFVVTGFKYFRSERSRREVTRQFEHFVSPDVIEEIIEDPERHLTPGGAQRELSIMFLDVRSFSTITERMEPQQVIAFVNTLLTPLTDAILDHEGTIDKYMGDAVMAFWNAPRETTNHEAKAVRTVLTFNQVMEDLRPKFAEMGLPEIKIGIGINTGECSVGNMGSLKRLAYSCVGDAVNLAARLEGQTKTYGVGNLIGSSTAAGAPGFAMIELDSVAVKGRTQPETVYTIAGDSVLLDDPIFKNLELQLIGARAAFLAQNWEVAARIYVEVSDHPTVGLFDPKPLVQMMLTRISEYQVTPPPPGWDGVYVATTK